MTEKRKLSAKQVLEDVKGGLSDDQLMSKHRLTARELQGVLGKLVEAGWLTQSQLDARTAIFEGPIDVSPPEEERGKQSVTRKPDSIILSSLFAGLVTGWTFAQVLTKSWLWFIIWLPILSFMAIVGYYVFLEKYKNKIKYVVAAGTVFTLAILGIFLVKDRTNKPLSVDTVKQANQQRGGEVKPTRETTSDRKVTKSAADCEEPEIPFPVQSVRKNAPGSEVLAAIIRTKVILDPSSNFGYLSEGGKRTLTTVLQGEPPDTSGLIQYILETEHNCRGPVPPGILMGMVVSQFAMHTIPRIAEEKLAQAFPQESKRSAETRGQDWTPPSQVKKRQEETESASSEHQLRQRDSALRGKGLGNYADAFQALGDFVKTSVDKGIEERRQYSRAQEERKARITKCRERVIAEGLQRQQKDQEDRQKRMITEQEQRRKDADRYAQEIKSGKRPVASIGDLQLKLAVEDGDDYVEKPPTSTPNDRRHLLFAGTIETQQGNVIICKGRESMFDDDKFKIRKWAFKTDGLKSYIPRINEDVKVIGKISGVMSGKTVIGKTVHMVVVDAIAVEADGGKFYQR